MKTNKPAEISLSNFITKSEDFIPHTKVIRVKDVKKAVKKLKEDFCLDKRKENWDICPNCKKINAIFGKELTNG